jgi:uncharacterized protein YhfF
MIGKWATKYRWSERATAWDNRNAHVAQVKVEKIVASEAEFWATEARKQAQEGLSVGVLIREKARSIVSFPVAEAKKAEQAYDASGKPITIYDSQGNPSARVTIVNPLDPRDFAAASKMARDADELIWNAINQGRGLVREAEQKAPVMPGAEAVLGEASRRVAETVRAHRDAVMARRFGLNGHDETGQTNGNGNGTSHQ